MTYSTSEAALLTLIRAYNAGATFTAANSSRGDWSVVDATGTDLACVLAMNAPTLESEIIEDYGKQGKIQERHEIAIDVFHKRSQGLGGDSVAYVALTTLTDALRAYLRGYPRLNNTSGVRNTNIVGVSDVDIRKKSPHIFQTIVIRVYCESDEILVEYPR
jgi:hypothetical protein